MGYRTAPIYYVSSFDLDLVAKWALLTLHLFPLIYEKRQITIQEAYALE